MKLALGTAAFGLDYGVTNTSGRVAESEVAAILRAAEELGIAVLDTAAAYGDAEEVLGTRLDGTEGFRVVTKLPPLRADRVGPDELAASSAAFDRSLQRLRTDSVYALLVHDADDLLAPGGGALWELMARLRESGRVTRIGASLYTPEQAFSLLDRFGPDVVQAPFSVLDRRLADAGALAALAGAGVEVHARSAFLQGVLLEPPASLPAHLAALAPAVAAVHERAREIGVSPLQAALGFVLGVEEVTAVVCGVLSERHLRELAAVPACDPALFEGLGASAGPLVDPRNWSRA